MRDNFDLQLKTIKNPFHLAGRYILCSPCIRTKYISTTWNYIIDMNYASILYKLHRTVT